IGVNGAIGNGLIASSPSNLYVGTLYDHGVVGVGLLTLIFLALFASLVMKLRAARGEYRVLLAAVLAGLVSTILQSVEQDDFWEQAIGVYFWIIVALPFAMYWTRLPPLRESKGLAPGESARPQVANTSHLASRTHEHQEVTAHRSSDRPM